jgi:hypothetical protein
MVRFKSVGKVPFKALHDSDKDTAQPSIALPDVSDCEFPVNCEDDASFFLPEWNCDTGIGVPAVCDVLRAHSESSNDPVLGAADTNTKSQSPDAKKNCWRKHKRPILLGLVLLEGALSFLVYAVIYNFNIKKNAPSVILGNYTNASDDARASKAPSPSPPYTTTSPTALRGSSPSPTTPTSFSNAASKNCPSFARASSLPGKKGACMTLLDEAQHLPKIQSLLPYWNYRWGRERINAQPEGIEFLPMQWGGATDSATLQQLLDEQVAPYISTGQTKHFLGYNEPDQKGQANMSVERALELWPQLEALGLPLVSPSCANPHGTWMEQFMGNATESCLRVDWIGYHWYGGAQVSDFQAGLERIYEKYGLPVLVTEFAPCDWAAATAADNQYTQHDVLDFAKVVLPWMEAQDW